MKTKDPHTSSIDPIYYFFCSTHKYSYIGTETSYTKYLEDNFNLSLEEKMDSTVLIDKEGKPITTMSSEGIRHLIFISKKIGNKAELKILGMIGQKLAATVSKIVEFQIRTLKSMKKLKNIDLGKDYDNLSFDYEELGFLAIESMTSPLTNFSDLEIPDAAINFIKETAKKYITMESVKYLKKL